MSEFPSEFSKEVYEFTKFMRQCCPSGSTFEDILKNLEVPAKGQKGIENLINALISAFEERRGIQFEDSEAVVLGDAFFHALLLGSHLGKKQLL